jgi:hypothetical protein
MQEAAVAPEKGLAAARRGMASPPQCFWEIGREGKSGHDFGLGCRAARVRFFKRLVLGLVETLVGKYGVDPTTVEARQHSIRCIRVFFSYY